jgi:geranylgeranyl reductase family protein
MPGAIAVVGGGPAGAMAATELARSGLAVTLIDEKLAWEKPCGGGVTQKALEQYPFLADAQVERNWIRGCRLTSPSGRSACFALDRRIAIFSRQVLNRLLLDRAREAGANIVRDRVLAIEGSPGNFRIRTRNAVQPAGYVVIAGGARTPFRRQFSSPLAPADLMLTAGYFLPFGGADIEIAFLENLEGYIWIFPRRGHSSAGICARMQTTTAPALRQRLDDFLRRRGFALAGAEFYSHVLPAPRAQTLERAPLEGRGWALVGDAAGLVDPITGEGLYYAIRSAALLAHAIAANRSYARLLARDFLPELKLAARVAERFYRGGFLGRSVLERVVQFTASSATIRELTRDLFAGTQGYRGLRARFYRSFPRALLEMWVRSSGSVDPSPSVRDAV